MNLILPSGLEDSYLFSALSLAALFATVLLLVKLLAIFWVNDAVLFGNPIHHVEVEIPNVKMSKVSVPFTFDLHDKKISTFEGIHCLVSSEVGYRLEAYWGVSIADLHFFLRQPWDLTSITSLDQTPLKSHCQQITSVLRDKSHDVKGITLELSEKLNLGIPPRQYYPLVVFLVRDSASESLQPDETVALINIVHIKDNSCTLPTSLLAQYLKQANGRLTTLKHLYVASANINCDDEEKSVKKENGTEPLCIVCQVHPISRALLPCRHTCICAVCFNKIFACPLCRSPITSYFMVRSEEYYKESDKIMYTRDSGTFSQWFHDRITDFLGFER